MLGERDIKKARKLISFTWPGESVMVCFKRSHSNLLHFNMKVDSCILRRIPALIAAVVWMDPAPSERIPSFMSSRLIVRLISIPHISTERTTCSLYLLLLELQCASWDTSPLLLFGGLYLYIYFFGRGWHPWHLFPRQQRFPRTPHACALFTPRS